MANATEIKALSYTTKYFLRLLAERHAIRSALKNHGGSIILQGYNRVGIDFSYPSAIGNDFHLDLLEAEEMLTEMSTADRVALTGWADSLKAEQATDFTTATPAALRQRRSRAAKKAVKRLNNGTPQGKADATNA
jgi:hypothetical protein